MGIALLTEEEYRDLQRLGEFDTKTSSWLVTPPAIRKRGGAIFGDRRYDHVFVYHNGAISYYAATWVSRLAAGVGGGAREQRSCQPRRRCRCALIACSPS